jgi:biotin transporter BioY
MKDIEQSARKSWRLRRRIKRLLFSWIVICVLCAEAGASWFGIFIAEHAPMPLADAKVIAERTATVVFAISFAAMMVAAVLQFKVRERLRRIESTRLQSVHAT